MMLQMYPGEIMNTGHQIVGFIIFLQAIYFLNKDRKPYFLGLTTKSVLVKNQLGRGTLIGLYIFVFVAALAVVAQDLYSIIVNVENLCM